MNRIAFLFASEPVAVWCGLVQAVLTLAVSFGLSLTPEQKGCIITVAGIVLAVLARSKVSPNSNPTPSEPK